MHANFGHIAESEAILLINGPGPGSSPLTPSMLIELGVAAYLKKPAYVMFETEDKKLEHDLKLTVIRGDLHQIPKVLFG